MKTASLMIILFLAVADRALAICAVPQFTTIQSIAVDRPKALAIADFNGDRIRDLAILRDSLNPNGGVVQVWTGNAAGGFTWTGNNNLAVTANVIDLAAADFDQDGNNDVAVIGGPIPNYVVGLLFGNGAGGFAPVVTFAAGSDPRDVAAADFNGDGRPDIVVADFAGRTASILPNNGNRSFGTPIGIPTGGPAPVAVVTGFFDSNFTQDLVTVNNDRTLSVRLGNGNFTFASIDIPATLTGTQQDLAAADLNRDGFTDLAAASFSDAVSLRLGSENGLFTVPPGDPFPAANVVNHLAVADVNGDLMPDIAAAANGVSGANNLSVLLNSGSGGLTPAFNFTPATGVSPKVYSIDFDRNRSPDLLLLKEAGSNIIVRLRNDCLFRYPAVADFDRDGKTDISIFRAGNGQWWINRSAAGVIAHTFGNSTDVPAPADFTGDGKTDVAVFRPGTGEWFVLRSENATFYSFPFGASGDVPVPNDFDGDGTADAAVFRPPNATWYVQRSGGGTIIESFGANGDLPVPADYDGDGVTDLAIFRPGLGQWWLKRSTAGLVVHTFGNSSDKRVPGDYTGDGKADVAVWRPSTGEWFVLRSQDSSYYSVPFGSNGDIPIPGDYDGDGRTDTAVFRVSSGTWYVNRSTSGLLVQNFGLATDIPLPSVFTR